MSSNKTLALALCFAITGCAQTPQKDAAAPVASSHWYWPFGSDDSAGKPAVKPEVKPEVKPVAVTKAETDSGSKWYWPFGGSEKSAAKAVPMPDPKVTQAWLDDYEPRLREAVKGSNMQLERRENVLVVTCLLYTSDAADE